MGSAHAANEAIIDVPNSRRLTYAEFDGLVRRLANGLRGLGLEKGDRFGVLSRNCAEYMALYFAAGRAGLMLQPLNWRLAGAELADHRPRRRAQGDHQPGRVRARPSSSSSATSTCRTGCSSATRATAASTQLVESSSDDEPIWVSPVLDDDPFFILYTGGTTGKSKGAMHTHRSAGAMMLAQTVAERIVPSDVYMLTGQMYHIPIVLAMNYNRHGCPLVLVNFEAKQALEIIQEEKVSAFLGITTMINWMMARAGLRELRPLQPAQLPVRRRPMPSSVVRAAMDNFPCTMIQGYGQTEGAGMTFLSQEDHIRAVNGDHPERLRSCGREGFTAQIRVVDDNGRDVPQDGKTAGQIVVRGEQNMTGYLNQPDLTAQTLRDGWMWTGDMATWDDERYIFIVDRAKDMIISGGENIYSVQVEEAINQHPAVLECAVFGIPDDEWGEAVKAVVVLKPGQEATEQDIIDEAKKHLASYQKPRSVDFVGAAAQGPHREDPQARAAHALLGRPRPGRLSGLRGGRPRRPASAARSRGASTPSIRGARGCWPTPCWRSRPPSPPAGHQVAHPLFAWMAATGAHGHHLGRAVLLVRRRGRRTARCSASTDDAAPADAGGRDLPGERRHRLGRAQGGPADRSVRHRRLRDGPAPRRRPRRTCWNSIVFPRRDA